MKKRLLSLLMVLAMLATLLPVGMVSVSAADTKTIVCVGDSITQGSGSTGGYPYPTYLQNLLGSGYTVVNKGLSGRTMGNYEDGCQYTYKATDGTMYGNGSAAQVDQATVESADTIIIMLGTNDTKKTVDEFTDPFVSAYKTMIDTFAQWNSDVNFVLATSPNSLVTGTNTWASADRLAVANALVKDTMVVYAGEKTTGSVSLIDVYTEMADFTTDSTLWYDTVHPNYKGYEKLAGVFYKEFWDTTVHSFAVTDVDAANISIDTEAATIGIAAESVSGTATVEVAANSTADTVDLSALTVEEPITFTVTAKHDGNSCNWTVYLTDDASDFEKTLIYNADQLKGLQGQALVGDYKLMADIDLGAITWNPIISLTGTFDGNGHTITLNTTLSANNYGFIKTINANSTVKGLTMAGAINANAQNYIGVLAYENKGIIENCVNQATITNAGSSAYAAGIVADNYGLVNNCGNTAAITGSNNYLAGIAAALKSGGVVANCYNTGDLTIDSNGIGGIVGDATAGGNTIINCYNTGECTSLNTSDGRIVAGIVGSGGNLPSNGVVIQNCWNTGVIKAKLDNGQIGNRMTGCTQNNCYTSTADSATAQASLNANLFSGVTYGDTLYDLNSWTATNGVPAFGAAVTAMPVDENGAYHLKTKEHFDWWVAAVRADASVSAVLECDITMTGEWTTIPNLTGTFDGGNHTISGLTITNATTATQGLFGTIAGGTVKNVVLTNVSISSSNTKIGGIAGRITYGTISNCTVSGTISSIHEGGSSNVGGIVGEAGGNTSNIVVIEGCTNNANISITHANENDKNVGGIVGQGAMNSMYGSVIRNCVNNGTITGVSTLSKKLAGIAGETYYSIVNCVNTGAISGKVDIGGIVGVSYNGDDPAVEGTYDWQTYVLNCYNTGTITASGNQGGIAGRVNMFSHMYNCYTVGAYGPVAGIHTAANLSNNYYCSDTATASKTGTGKTAADMQTADFVRVLNNYVIEKKDDKTFAAWNMSKWAKGTNNYPVHTGELADADDVVDNTAQIETAAQLLAINNQSGEYTLSNDITITAEDASAITVEYLINAFNGTLNGNGKTITINCNKILFNNLTATAKVKNLTIAGTINLSTTLNVAPLVIHCRGTVDGCSFVGSVIGNQYVAGIAAQVYAGGTIVNCSTSASATVEAVNADNVFLGGIVARLQDTTVSVRNCVNNATLTASGANNKDYTGGIVAQISDGAYAVIDGCTNKGTINAGNTTGGIVGAAEKNTTTLVITNCQNTGTINGFNYVGGIAGRMQNGLQLYVVNCSNTGAITKTGNAAGIVGTLRWGSSVAYVYNCYSSTTSPVVLEQAGSETQGNHTLHSGNGYSTSEGTTVDTMKSAGFVLTLDSYVPSEAVQKVLTANNITLKTWEYASGATPVLGTAAIGSKGGIKNEDGVLLIGNEVQLLYFASNSSTSARLTADIALTNDWTTITTAYTGTFDGNGHTISGFKQVDQANGNVGMFKELAAAGTIKNLTLAGNIDCPNARNVGGFVSVNRGLIYGCTNKINIAGLDDNGKIVRDTNGYLMYEGAYEHVGGLVGQNYGTIDSCVNRGVVVAFKDYAGGIAGEGYENSLIVNCLNNGEIAHVRSELLESTGNYDNGGSGTGGILGGAGKNVAAYVVNCYNSGWVYDNNLHRGYVGGIIGDRGYAYNCYNTGDVYWYKWNGTEFGSVTVVNCHGIDGRADNEQPSVSTCYMLSGNNGGNGGTKMELSAMQTTDFATTLNNGVTTIPDSIKTALGDITLRRWRYVEGDTPILSDGVIVTATGNYGESLLNVVVGSAEELETVMATVKIPALGGYLFVGWNEPTDKDAFAMAYESLTQQIALTPVYKVDEEGNKHTVTATNATTNVSEGTFDTRVEATAADEYKGNVAYWLLDGAKVGFGEDTYIFYISGNSTIIAVSKGEAADITPEVVLQQATSSTDGEKYTLTVVAQTSIPDGTTVKSYGVYYTASTSALTALKAGNAEAGTYVQVESSKTDANRQYMTHLLGVASGKTRYAMAYAVLEDDTVIFSSVVVQFKTTADGVDIVKGAI